MSGSDANVDNLIEHGVLDAIEVMLMQSQDAMTDWFEWYMYNVRATRGGFASVAAERKKWFLAHFETT
eukprot:COSAG02_NODE_3709_length_6347_cov_2.619558_2_plen_68_part_00